MLPQTGTDQEGLASLFGGAVLLSDSDCDWPVRLAAYGPP